ncbi:MAG: T9SS type A sorting domain-containing protein [Bacteroidetes bacterium]|nr:T9SS type A sorting domain-containing protein [Bacteroidota bacterium]
MKKQLYALGATLLLAALNTTAQAQANDWIIPPRTLITFGSSTSVSLLSASSALATCGTSAADKYAWVLSDAQGHGQAFVNGCGIYNMSGSSVGSGTGNDIRNVFAVPGMCNTYYALQWENVPAAPSFNKLTLRTLDIGASVTQSSSADIINDANMHFGVTVAVAPLEANGDRKVYVSSDLDLICLEFDIYGTLISNSTIATLPNTVDLRTGMEVSPDGTRILLSTGIRLYMYDIAAGSFTSLGSFSHNVTIAGFEYVPMSSGDRVYFSYHFWDGFNTENGLDYVTLAAPTTNVDAISGVSAPAKYAYGYTDIERGKDGKLYFAYHNNYSAHIITSGDVGTLVSMTTTATSPSTVYDGGGSAVQVQSLTRLGYIIQKQIDGEDYTNLYGALAGPSFTLSPSSPSGVSTIPNVYFCDSSLMLDATFYGPHDLYKLTLETGTVSGSGGVYTFTPDAIQPTTITYSDFNPLAHFSTNIRDGFGGCDSAHRWIDYYRGPIRVSLQSVSSGCSSQFGHTIVRQVYNLVDPIDFLLTSIQDNAPDHVGYDRSYSCSSSPLFDPITWSTLHGGNDSAQDRNYANQFALGQCGPTFDTFGTDPMQSNLIMDPTLEPICHWGWLGASTAGIFPPSNPTFFNPYNVSIGTIDSFDIKVEEFDQSIAGARLTPSIIGATGDNVVLWDRRITTNLSTGGIDPLHGYVFDQHTLPSLPNYFTVNYLSIKGVKVYQVTYKVHTHGGACDEMQAISFFKILDDGSTIYNPNGGVNWRVAATTFQAYPNPASSELNLTWTNTRSSGLTEVIVSDMLGHIVLRQSLEEPKGNNVHRLDVAKLAPGVYHFAVTADGVLQNGKLVKE